MTPLQSRQKEFATYLVVGFPEFGLKGLPVISASAVTGNATQENSVNPVTSGQKDHGSDGVMQWRLDRLDGPVGLKGWAAAHSLPWNILSTQAAFFIYECERDYPALIADLRSGEKKIETLTANICKFYERPNPKYAALDRRIKAAKDTYLLMAPQAATTTAPLVKPLPPAIQAVTENTGLSWLGWACIAYAFACWNRVELFGFPTIGDPVTLVILGALAFVLNSWFGKKQSPAAASSMKPQERKPEMAILDELKKVLDAIEPEIGTALANQTAMKGQIDKLSSLNAVVEEVAADLPQIVSRIHALLDSVRALNQAITDAKAPAPPAGGPTLPPGSPAA